MGRHKKSLINISEAMAKLDAWRNGRMNNFNSGDVVESGDSEIGVVCFPHVDIDSYIVKWYSGPKPWNFVEKVTYGSQMRKSNKPNPLKYKDSERYPGPSFEAIEKLNVVFSEKSNKPKTGKEVDKYISILEEEIYRTNDNKKEEEIDSVVDETLDAEPNVGEIIDSVDMKRKKIIEDDI